MYCDDWLNLIFTEYAETFCADFYEKLKNMIDKGMEKIDSLHWNPLYVEVLQHLHVARNVCKVIIVISFWHRAINIKFNNLVENIELIIK